MLVPWNHTFLLQPGVPQDISVSINGIPAALNCSAATVSLPASATGTPAVADEPQSFSIPDGSCQYVYSSYADSRASSVNVTRTASNQPVLTIIGTGAARRCHWLQGQAAIEGGNRRLCVPALSWVALLSAGMSTNASAYTITLNGNLSCANVAVQDQGSGKATLTCTPPDLPAGSYPLLVVQAGKGQMSAPPSKPNNTMTAGAAAGACRLVVNCACPPAALRRGRGLLHPLPPPLF